MEPCTLTRQQVAQIEEIPAQLMWALCWSQRFGIPVLPCRPRVKATTKPRVRWSLVAS